MPIEPPPGAYDEDGYPLNSAEGDVWLSMPHSLRHLADWLDEGEDLTPLLKSELIEILRHPAIEKAYLSITIVTDAEKRRGKRRTRQAAIGAWIAVRMDHSAWGMGARILFEAAQLFGISEALAEKHLNDFRKQSRLSWDEADYTASTLRERAFARMCRERGLDPDLALAAVNSGKKLDLNF